MRCMSSMLLVTSQNDFESLTVGHCSFQNIRPHKHQLPLPRLHLYCHLRLQLQTHRQHLGSASFLPLQFSDGDISCVVPVLLTLNAKLIVPVLVVVVVIHWQLNVVVSHLFPSMNWVGALADCFWTRNNASSVSYLSVKESEQYCFRGLCATALPRSWWLQTASSHRCFKSSEICISFMLIRYLAFSVYVTNNKDFDSKELSCEYQNLDVVCLATVHI